MELAVLWENTTTKKEATRKNPFKLAFGSEVVLPVEVGLPSYWIKYKKYGEQRLSSKKKLGFLSRNKVGGRT